MATVNDRIPQSIVETAHDLPTSELLKEIASTATTLVKKEVDLARVELKEDVASELAMVKGVGVAAVAAIATVNLLLVAAVFALATVMTPWLAALIIAGATLVIAVVTGLIGWSKHVAQPLARTRKTLEDDARFVKEEIV
jgi:uncharacterized membrane protein YqjE